MKSASMDEILYFAEPSLHEPALVAGFGGWGNAGEVATTTIDYMVERLQAEKLATFGSDDFYLFSVNRPLVTIHNGHLKSLDLPRSQFYYSTTSHGSDLILFYGPEPQLRWNQYAKAFMGLCQRYQVKVFITLGGFHDEVLHNEEKISAAGASPDDVQKLRELDEPVGLIDYIGPSAIHSLFLAKAQEFNMQSMSLWAHAASYLQGTNYKLCAALIRRLNQLLHVEIDSTELELSWRLLEEQIEDLIANNDQLRLHVQDLKTRDERGGFASPTSSPAKVIRLDEFIKHNKPEE
jgi:proteasome assembly chaperone (PAC2) family protein